MSSFKAHRHPACWLAGAAAGLIVLSLACTQKSTGPARQAEKPVAATAVASCVSCHENLENEMIVRVHARRGKSCTDCHGQSTAHAAGGSPQPSPDHTFADNDIEKLCTQCHRRHNQEMIARFVQRRQGRLSPHGQPITTDSHCTDCHGHHVREG